MAFPKFLHPELPAKERLELIRDSADAHIENHKYTRRLTDNEIQERKDNLSELSIKVSDLQIKKKEATQEFDKEIKPLQTEFAKTRGEIKTRQREVEEDIYILYDYDNELAYEYAGTGEQIQRRLMKEEERQQTIMRPIRESRVSNGE